VAPAFFLVPAPCTGGERKKNLKKNQQRGGGEKKEKTYLCRPRGGGRKGEGHLGGPSPSGKKGKRSEKKGGKRVGPAGCAGRERGKGGGGGGAARIIIFASANGEGGGREVIR